MPKIFGPGLVLSPCVLAVGVPRFTLAFSPCDSVPCEGALRSGAARSRGRDARMRGRRLVSLVVLGLVWAGWGGAPALPGRRAGPDPSGVRPRQAGPQSQQAGREAARAGQREPDPEGPRRSPSADHAHWQRWRTDGAGAGRRVHDGQCRGRRRRHRSIASTSIVFISTPSK